MEVHVNMKWIMNYEAYHKCDAESPKWDEDMDMKVELKMSPKYETLKSRARKTSHVQSNLGNDHAK